MVVDRSSCMGYVQLMEHQFRLRSGFLLCLSLLAFPDTTAAQTTSEVIAETSPNNQASPSAIQTVAAKVQFRTDSPGFGQSVWRANYLRSLTATRITEIGEKGEITNDVVNRGGTQKGLAGTSGVIASENERITDLDAWSLALFTLPQHRERLTLTEMLALSTTKAISAKVVTEEGKRRVRVEFVSPEGVEFKVRLAPEVNYLIDRIETTTTSKVLSQTVKLRSEYAISSFKEVIPTLYFPDLIVSQHYRQGKLVVVQTTNITDIKLNHAIRESAFDLKFPNGTSVTNRINGTVYRSGPNEAPVGPVAPYSPSTQESVQHATPLTTTESSAWSTSRIIIYCSLMMIAIGLTFAIRTRIRQQVS